MKKSTSLIVLLLVAGRLFSQDPKINRDNLVKLNGMTGNWKGEATIQQRGKAPIKVHQEEKIEWRLDSLVLIIEGTGKDQITKKINFHAFAVISYNQQTSQLEMKSFTMEGRQTNAYFNILDSEKFAWGFDVPGGKIKYTIVLSNQDKAWNEKGEFSPDGAQWFPFFDMNLVKQ